MDYDNLLEGADVTEEGEQIMRNDYPILWDFLTKYESDWNDNHPVINFVKLVNELLESENIISEGPSMTNYPYIKEVTNNTLVQYGAIDMAEFAIQVGMIEMLKVILSGLKNTLEPNEQWSDVIDKLMETEAGYPSWEAREVLMSMY